MIILIMIKFHEQIEKSKKKTDEPAQSRHRSRCKRGREANQSSLAFQKFDKPDTTWNANERTYGKRVIDPLLTGKGA